MNLVAALESMIGKARALGAGGVCSHTVPVAVVVVGQPAGLVCADTCQKCGAMVHTKFIQIVDEAAAERVAKAYGVPVKS